jgi:hypothetical protein
MTKETSVPQEPVQFGDLRGMPNFAEFLEHAKPSLLLEKFAQVQPMMGTIKQDQILNEGMVTEYHSLDYKGDRSIANVIKWLQSIDNPEQVRLDWSDDDLWIHWAETRPATLDEVSMATALKELRPKPQVINR